MAQKTMELGDLTSEQTAQLYDAFALLDKNNDGKINAFELREILISMGNSPSEGFVKGLVAKFDSDKDGQIDFPEFLNWVGKDPRIWEAIEMSKTRMLFQLFDQDGDGSITFEEIRLALCRQYGTKEVSQNEVQEMLDEADKDGDGKLSYEEFEAIVTQYHGPDAGASS